MIEKDDFIFSVLIPTRNQAQFIERCLNSLINLSQFKFEIVIINNCSTDNTHDLIEKFISGNYPNIHVNYTLRENPVSIEVNTIDAINLASGKYILLIGSDDYFNIDSVDKYLMRLESEGRDFGAALLQIQDFEVSTLIYREVRPINIPADFGSDKTKTIKWMLNNVNQEEFIFSIWPRETILKAVSFTRYPTLEPICWWWSLNALIISLDSKKILLGEDILQFKQIYPKISTKNSYVDTKKAVLQKLTFLIDTFYVGFKQRKNSVLNAFSLYLHNFITISQLFLLLFSKRYFFGISRKSYFIFSSSGTFVKYNTEMRD
jgi:glycosyltransferase involved in cell wall biosynthesis